MTKTIVKRTEYKFLDGLRGIAAMTVVLLHVYLMTGYIGDTERNLAGVFQAIPVIGTFGVPMFIVLSGFVLTISIAGPSNFKLPKGFWGYIKRRARRILPPYYASLLVFLALIWLVPAMSKQIGTAWDSKIPVTPSGIVAHILVVHNLNKDWVYQINGPAWSVATEWQLYFALPLLLLPIWRKFGRLAMLGTAVVIGPAVSFIFPSTFSGHLWFLSLFALGAIGADICVNRRSVPALGIWTPLIWIAAIAAAATGIPLIRLMGESPYLLFSESLAGGAVFLLVVLLAKQRGSLVRVMRQFLESRPLVWMGSWSYSLYLIHSPIIGLGNILMLEVEMTTVERFAFQLLVTMPISMAAAFVFHVLVERRFMTSHQSESRVKHKNPQQAVLDPA